jgi:hypothetical protein
MHVVCKLVIAYAEEFLSSNSTESEIEQFLDKVCNTSFIVRLGFSAECTDLVNVYLPELVQILVNKETPTVACTQVLLCDLDCSL